MQIFCKFQHKKHSKMLRMHHSNDNQIALAGDKIIVLAEDDDTYSPAEPAEQEVQMLCPDWRPKKRMERILFLGWRRDMHDIITVLDKFVDQGSELWLYNEVGCSCRSSAGFRALQTSFCAHWAKFDSYRTISYRAPFSLV